MDKNVLKSLLVAGMLAVGTGMQAKEDVTGLYLQNAGLTSLDGWNHVGYTDWRTDGGVPVIEFWNWESQFNFDQTITLSKGDYRLAVNSFYRESWGGNGTNNNMAWIFAGEKKQNVIALNSMSDLSGYAGSNDLYKAATAFSLGKFSNEFDFSIEADGTEITIGFTGTTPNGGWCILGPVKLYQYTLEDYMVDYRAKVAEAELYLDEKMSAEARAALNAAIVEESTLASAVDVAEAIQNLNEAINAAQASIAGYAKLNAALDKGDTFIEEAITNGGAPESCASALDAIKAEYEAGTIADADIDAKIAEISAVMLSVAKQQTKVGADMTALLTNPYFEQEEYGWTVEAATGSGPNGRAGNVRPGGSAENRCYEAWNSPKFDIYQIVENAPYGVYEIEVQGFYRYGRGETAWNAYQAQEVEYVKKEGVPVYVYMNDNATPFVNVFAEPVTYGDLYTNSVSDDTYTDPNGEYWYPNQMNSSAEAFSAGMYKQKAHGLVAFEGDVLRLGVKGVSSQLNDSWVIWDNFKLIYKGFDPDVIKPVLEETVKDVEDNYIGLLMGKTEYAAFTTALADAAKAIAENDGEGMFKALRDLYAAKDPALTSKDIFLANEVAADTLRLAEGIRAVEGKKLAKSTLAAANDLLDGLKNNTIYENEDAIMADESTPSAIQTDVTAMIERLNASVALYSQFNEAIGRLQNAISEVSGEGQHVSKAMLDEALALKENSTTAYNEGSVSDVDVPSIINNIDSFIEALTRSVELYQQLAEAITSLENAIDEAQEENKNEELVSKELLANATALLGSAKEEHANSSLDNEGVEARLQDIDDMVQRLEAAVSSLYFYVDPLTYHITSVTELTVEVVKCRFDFAGEIEIPETVMNNGITYIVTGIAATAFQHCVYVTYVSIPWSVVYMGSGCFDGCTSLGGISYSGGGDGGSGYGTDWTIDDNVTTITSQYLTEMAIIWNDLTAVTLPATLRSIGEKCFYGCFRLMTVTSMITDLFPISDDTFADVTYMFGTLIVPDGTKSLYENTSGWKNFKNIIELSAVGVDSQLADGKSICDVYTLGGQKVASTAKKGLYIMNGKKVVKKQ